MLFHSSKRLPLLQATLSDQGLKVGPPDTHGFWGYHAANGDGIKVEYNCSEQSLEVTSDQYGFMPLFYSWVNGQLNISSNLDDLISASSELSIDDAAMAVFLRAIMFIGNDTPFKEIRRVPPASTLRISPDGFTINTAQPFIQKEITDLSRNASAEMFAELFEDAIRQLAPEEGSLIGLPLSGGRDSRHILYALMNSGHAPDVCMTIRPELPSAMDDAETAAIVARHFNLKHALFEPPTQTVRAEMIKNTLTDFSVIENGTMLPLGDYTRQANTDFIYDGIAGDVLSVGSYTSKQRLDCFDEGQLDTLADSILGADGYLPHMLEDNHYRRWSRDLAIDHLRTELERFQNRTNPVSEFFFANRTRNAVAPATWKIFAGNGMAIAPFLHRPLYDFLRSLPPSFTLDKSFHNETIARRYPQYRNLPFEDRTTPRKLLPRKQINQNAWDFTRTLTSSSSKTFLNRSWLLAKTAYSVLSKTHGSMFPLLIRRPVYLAQLAKRMEKTP